MAYYKIESNPSYPDYHYIDHTIHAATSCTSVFEIEDNYDAIFGDRLRREQIAELKASLPLCSG